MGSSASKATRAASSTVRKYPSRVPHASPTSHQRTPSSKPAPQPSPSPAAHHQPSSSPAQDSELTARMLKLGPASIPSSPSFPAAAKSHSQQLIFPSPSANPAVTLLEARAKFASQAEAEFEEVARQGTGKRGREFLDVATIRRVLVMRDEKKLADAEIEKSLGLKTGTVGRLGKGVVGAA